MAAVLFSIVAMTVVGLLVALAIDRTLRGAMLLGLAFLYGSGAVWAAMLALSIVHIAWTIPSVTIALLVIAIAAFIVERKSTDHSSLITDHSSRPHIFDLATLLTVAGYSAYVTIAPLWEWDFWAIWGLKARMFLAVRGIDWAFLERRWNVFCHPDYPLLVPLNYDFATLLAGGWSDRRLGIFMIVWSVALLLVVRALTRDEASNFVSSMTTFAVSSVAMSRFIGMAEGAMIAFAGAAILFVRRALMTDDRMAWRHGALLLGLAASSKNEGVALILAIVIAIIAYEPRAWRRVTRLWPALAVIAPWMILRAVHVLPTDIAQGNVVSRMIGRLSQAPFIINYISKHTWDVWAWVAMLVALAVLPHAMRVRERFVLVVVLIQIAFYVAVYFATPSEPRWHIVTSWTRLTVQVQTPITVVTVLLLAQWLRRGDDRAHAEARSEQP